MVFQGALMVVRQGAQGAQGAVDQGCGWRGCLQLRGWGGGGGGLALLPAAALLLMAVAEQVCMVRRPRSRVAKGVGC